MNKQELDQLSTWVAKNIHDNGHHILSPSGHAGWSRCTGSMIGLHESRSKSADNIASIEGTLAHLLLELSIIYWVSPMEVRFTPKGEMMKGVEKWIEGIKLNPNNTLDVIEYAQHCLITVILGTYPYEMREEITKCYNRILAYKNYGYTVYAESKVSLLAKFGHTHCDGTADVVMFKGTHLVIPDLKYGKGIEVSPVKLGQGQLYAGGAVEKVWNETGQIISEITIVIMQPRIGNGVWKEWNISRQELENFLTVAKEQSYKALCTLAGGEVFYNASEKACQWCHRRKNCKARYEQVQQVVMEAFRVAGVTEQTVNQSKPDDIPGEALARILNQMPFVTGFFNDMANEAQLRARAGAVVPGYKLVRGRSARAWSNGEVVKFECAMSGIAENDYTISSLKSPAQMEKIRGLNKEQKEMIKSETITSYGSNLLVPQSDPRQSVATVAEQFAAAGLVQPKNDDIPF